ncbi:MAG: hypothetical protein ACT6QS_02660 [Flavobacteriales bacterium]
MRNKNVFIRFILFLSVSILLQYGYAQPNIPNITADYTVNQFTGGPAGAGVTDPSFSAIAAGTADFRDKSADILVSLFVDPDDNICYDGHVKVSVDLEVQYRTVNPFGSPSSVITEYITLEVEKSPLLLTEKDLERSFKVYKDAYKCDVSILAVNAQDANGTAIPTANIPDDIRIEVELQRTRYYNMPASLPARVTTFMSGNPLEQTDRYNMDNVVVVRWNTLPWVSEYELEWVFVEDFGTDFSTQIPSGSLPVQFKNNASRVRVPASQNTFYIPVVYTTGYVVARVRGVTRGGPALEDDLFGPWSFDDANSGTLTVDDAPPGSKQKISFGNSYLLNHINAQYTVSFTEDGKILPKGTYADGTLRIRQENVAAAIGSADINDYTKMGVVAETIYDFLGRPAVSTLPAVTERGFSYKVNYNQDWWGFKYSYLNFDFIPPENGLCYGESQGMGDSRGAGLYYSDNNPDMNGPQGRLPDAFDFPFTRIIYEADNASRPKIQSGVGYDHRIGNGHETQYVYGNPSQTDLNRLFGTDAGYAGYYQKSMIKDANGQVSITYTDLAGKTIATSLAGKSPDNLDPLQVDGNGTPLEDLGEEVNEDLLEITTANPHGNQNLPSADLTSYTANHFLMVTSDKDYHISYTLTGRDFEDDCVPDFCADCIYDLEISLTDDCGNYIIGNAQGNGPMTIRIPGSVINDECQDGDPYDYDYDTIVPLKMGAYNLVKKLTVASDALEEYLDIIMSRDTCLKPLSFFYDPPDVSDCFIDCESCLDALGDEEDFVAENEADLGSQEAAIAMYNNLKEQCRSLCGEAYKDECSLGYEMMLQDVSLMGQYGEFAAGDASAYPVSIFNVSNELPVRAQEQFVDPFSSTPQAGSLEFAPISAGGLKGSWKRPRYFDPTDNTWKRGYYDELGNRVRITVTENEDGSFSPEPENWVTPETDPLTGTRYIYPEFLENLSDFLDAWRPSFAKSLVVFHPEYFKYQFCSNAFTYTSQVDNGAGTNVEVNTYEYARMLERYPASVAVAELGLSGSMTPVAVINTILAADPFFSDPGSFANQNLMNAGPPVTAKDIMFYKLMTYQPISGVPANIVQIAYANVNCGIAPIPPCPLITSIDFSTVPQADQIWRRTAILYATVRQEAMGLAMDVYQTTKRNGIHTDCIGNNEYSLPPDLQSTLEYFAGNTVNPCGFPDMYFYAHKDQRFPSFSSMLAEAGFSDPPNPDEFDEYAVQAGQTVTGKCPMQIDFENMLSVLAQNSFLAVGTNTVVDLSAGQYLGSTLYQHLDGLGSFNANITVTSTLVTIVTAGSCTTTLSWPAGVPSYYDWSDIYLLADVHNGPGGPSLYGYIIDGTPASIEIPFTTCLPLTGCSASGRGICKPTQDIKDLKALINALSTNGDLWVTGTALPLTNYEMFITPNLRTILGHETNPASYTWLFDGSTPACTLRNTVNNAQIILNLNTGTSTISFPPALTYTFPSIYQVTPVTTTPTSDPAFSFGAVVETGNTFYYIPPGTTVEKLNGTIATANTLRNVYASECDAVQDPRCNTQAHENLLYIYNTLSKAIQTTEQNLAFIGFGDCIVAEETYTNGDPVDISQVISVEGVYADMSQSENGEYSYSGKVVFILTGNVERALYFKSCMPLKNCDPCNEEPCTYMTTTLDMGYIDSVFAEIPISWPYGNYSITGMLGSFSVPSCVELPDITLQYNSSYPSFSDFLDALVAQANTVNGVQASYNYNDMTITLQIDNTFLNPNCICDSSYVGLKMPPLQGDLPMLISLGVVACCDDRGGEPQARYGVLADVDRKGKLRTTLARKIWPSAGGQQSEKSMLLNEGEDEWDTPVDFSYDINCNEPVVPFPKDTVIDECVQYLLDLAAETAYNDYQAYLEQVRNAYREAYLTQCMSALETLNAVYESDEYHFTLYYYDRAGNLARTVPPRAVKRIPLADMPAVNAARVAGTESKPDHNDGSLSPVSSQYLESYALTTRYCYNAFNQATSQQTPDGGLSTFYYDNLGRVVLSQNAKQRNEGRVYSFTIYDGQSRITEVGQMSRTDLQSPSLAYLHNPVGTAAFFASGYTKGQCTRTYYDDIAFVPSGVLYPAGFFSQENLRKRVVCTTYQPEEGFPAGDESFTAATHYDYDYHGNVRQMLNDNTLMPDSDPLDFTYNFRYSKVDYRYDLVSGKVREVALNRSRQDKFIHRYTYDDQNRIREAKTSKDGYWFDTDAAYEYFYHGPMARTEYGPYKSQGADYTYTIHGWLKSINSDNLYPRREPGQDGYTGGTTRFVARDAYGMSLTYYENDYTAINGTHVDFQLAVPAAYYSNRNLYNGNIVAMNNTLKQVADLQKSEPLLQVFAYDQLNRIKGSHTYIQNNYQATITPWNPAAPETDMFRTAYTYDHDGNIKTLDRYNKAGQQFDEFVYTYDNGKNQLLQVADDPLFTALVNYDVDNQGANNYEYDLIGNLLRDDAEQIAEIRWNTYGKVTAVYRASGSLKPDLEFHYDAAGHRIAKTVIPVGAGKWTEFYSLDAQGNILGIYRGGKDEEGDPYLKLTENIMYGSSRLGTWTRDELIHFEAQTPGIQKLDRGTKQYELSNHLGNVHATVSDRKKLICESEEAQYYEPEILNTYDYYPFGMLMEERKQYRLDCEEFSDTTYTEVFNDQFSAATTDWFYVDDMSNPTVSSGQMRVNRNGVSLVRLFTAVPGKQYRVRFRVNLFCDVPVMIMGNLQSSSTMMCTTSQAYEFIFTANDASCGIGFYSSFSSKGCVPNIDYVILEEMNITDTLICDPDSLSAYRFGFNGQMKDNEVVGLDGTSYTAEFWQYDPRVARRWNLDPKPTIGISSYAVFENFPTVFSDPLGDRIKGTRKEKKALKQRDDWESIKATYRGRKSSRDLVLHQVKGDSRVTDDVLNADIRSQVLNNHGGKGRQDYLYFTPLTETVRESYTFFGIGFVTRKPVQKQSRNRFISGTVIIRAISNVDGYGMDHVTVYGDTPSSPIYDADAGPVDVGYVPIVGGGNFDYSTTHSKKIVTIWSNDGSPLSGPHAGMVVIQVIGVRYVESRFIYSSHK